MSEIVEIRWHGRGGQGAVTAAKLVAETALVQDKYFQASPEYGPERMGAPIQAFTRISEKPIKIHSNVTNPDIVVVLDPTLMSVVDVTQGLKPNGCLIINTEEDAGTVKARYNLSNVKVFTVNASKIAIETIGKAIPNTPMLGALIKATQIMDLNKLIDHIKVSFSKKFSQEIVDGNITAVTRAYQEVTQA